MPTQYVQFQVIFLLIKELEKETPIAEDISVRLAI